MGGRRLEARLLTVQAAYAKNGTSRTVPPNSVLCAALAKLKETAGDADHVFVYPFKSYVRDPIQFTIENGMIVDIRGGVDPTILSDYAKSFGDPRAYAVSHIGWGLNRLLSRLHDIRLR